MTRSTRERSRSGKRSGTRSLSGLLLSTARVSKRRCEVAERRRDDSDVRGCFHSLCILCFLLVYFFWALLAVIDAVERLAFGVASSAKAEMIGTDDSVCREEGAMMGYQLSCSRGYQQDNVGENGKSRAMCRFSFYDFGRRYLDALPRLGSW